MAMESKTALLRSFAKLAAIAAAVMFTFMHLARAQSQDKAMSAAPAYEFEAASIKPYEGGPMNFMPGFSVDGYRATRVSLAQLIVAAYGVQLFQVNGPAWARSDQFTVEAKMDAETADAVNKLTPDQRKVAQRAMLRALLADRFALKLHNETKDGPVYFLTVAKSGSKMKPADPKTAFHATGPDGTPLTGLIALEDGEGGTLKDVASSIEMSRFTGLLSQQLHRPVIDKTELTGIYDFTLEFMPDSGPASAQTRTDDASTPATVDPGGASIFTAIQQQLGLKLDPGRGPVETLVIEHAEKPSGN
jgi:uncharacterized protein (TIGR03435 family)